MNDKTNDDLLIDILLKQAVTQSFEDEIAAIPPRSELEKMYTFSNEHTLKMERLFAREQRKERISCLLRGLRKATVSIAAAVTVIFGVFMLSPSIRAAVEDTAIEWFSQFVKFTSHGNVASIEERQWRPSFLPHGFYELDSDTKSEIENVRYINSDGAYIIFFYADSANTVSLDREYANYSKNIVDNIPYYFFESSEAEKDNAVVWEKDNCKFELVSKISIDELQKVALSVNLYKS